MAHGTETVTTTILLAGILADPVMMAALGVTPSGPPVNLPGQLRRCASEGLDPAAWPLLDPGAEGEHPAVPVTATAALDRYAAIMALSPIEVAQGRLLGVRIAVQPGEACQPGRPDVALAARVAEELLADPAPRPEALRARLPMIGWWAASRRRAALERGAPLPPGPPPGPAGDDRLRIESRRQPYAQYFAVQELCLRHRLHRGGWSAPLDRAVFVSGDAVVVLPWDPRRDRVLLVDQLRAGPAARGDGQPWLYEPVAGRIDAGESPESTARREAQEEAGVMLDRLFPVPGHYPSPGIVAEYIYGFVGTADLPDGSAIVSGLADEGEDIRGHLMPRHELTRMALAGEIANGPLLILALWLDRMAEELRAEAAAG